MSVIANDYGFQEIFSRQLRALCNLGDVALAISTRGNSSNLLRALEAAREMKMGIIGLTGRSGGAMRECVYPCLCVLSDSIPRIREAHVVIAHALRQLVRLAIH